MIPPRPTRPPRRSLSLRSQRLGLRLVLAHPVLFQRTRAFAPLLLGGLVLQAITGCTSAAGEQTAEEASEAALTPLLEMQEVTLGPGDQLDIVVFRHPDLTRTLTVPQSGRLFFPLVGEIEVANHPASQVRERIAGGLSEYLVDPQVNLEVKIQTSQRIVVLGEVRSPGVYTLAGGSAHLTEAIGMAGGFTLDADQAQVLLLRKQHGEMARHTLDFEQITEEGKLSNDVLVARGDVLYVPPTGLANAERWCRKVEALLRPVILTEEAVLLGIRVREEIINKPETSETNIIVTP
ncbi:MAG: polysaccharide biosynthesis/export family protein [Planctomycetota bacterium]